MNRLLLPLLAALALPTAVNAGNLGVADLMLNGLDVREEKKSKNLFLINVGRDTRSGTAEFSNGRFIIKTDEKSLKKMKREGNIPEDIELDESGILPNQVISYSFHITAVGGANIVYTLFYEDSEGQKQLASWGFGRKQENASENARNFNIAFLNWLNQK